MKTEPLIVERVLNAPPERIWKAITVREEMKIWYFDLEEFKPDVGFEFRFTGGPDEKKYLHICKVTEVIAGKKLKYSWRYDGVPGISYVTFELIREGSQTRVRLTHEGIESFPADNPHMRKENFVEGWTYLIGTSLAGYAEGKSE